MKIFCKECGRETKVVLVRPIFDSKTGDSKLSLVHAKCPYYRWWRRDGMHNWPIQVEVLTKKEVDKMFGSK